MSSSDHTDGPAIAAAGSRPAAAFAARGLLRKPSFLQLALGLLAIAGGSTSIVIAPGVPGMLGGALALCMLAIATIDAREFTIPNELVAIGFALGIAQASLDQSDSAFASISAALVRAVLLVLAFTIARAVYFRLRGRQGLGWGDVKLMGVAGVWLDWQMIPLAIEMAALSAIALYMLRQWRLRRSPRWGGRIPFGLFLAPAIWLSWLIGAMLSGI